MKEIVLTQDVYFKDTMFKTGTILVPNYIDEYGFAMVDSLDTGFFSNEYELHVPCLENK